MLLALPGRAATDGVNAKLTEAAAAIEQALEHSSMPGLVVGITIAMSAQGHRHGYGTEDAQALRPIPSCDRSISKAFTAIALMQIGQEHRFEPHAPITRYLPSLVVHSRFAPITGHDLMSHTSGLPKLSARLRLLALRGHRAQGLRAQLRARHALWYSNTGFQLLGYALENIEHEPYTKVLRRRVLDPIGMASTSASR